MDTYNHYAEAELIAENLVAQGLISEAENIRYVISEGRSGTEIFMQLKFYLKPLLNNTNIAVDTRSHIAVLVGKIEKALM